MRKPLSTMKFVAPLLALWITTATHAEIITLTGSATAKIQAFKNDQEIERDEATDSFPDTSETLPLQVVARLSTQDEAAAGAVAAQLEDPLTATGANPEEFAINLTLNSLPDELLAYTGRATLEEVRSVRFRPDEVGAATGSDVRLRGQLFLDGVFALLATDAGQDLTRAGITLTITIKQERGDAEPIEVFAGSLAMQGQEDGTILLTATGDLPTSGILRADLSFTDETLAVFDVVALPSLVLSYDYEARVDETFTLRATVQVDASNQSDGVGVTAILGTPTGTFTEVLTLTQGAVQASKLLTALEQERTSPTGAPAFPTLRFGLPACGLLGFEFVVGLAGLAALRMHRRG